MPAGHHLFTAPKGVSEMQMYPWNDYSGRLSPLKLVVFVSLFVPASWVAVAYFFDLLTYVKKSLKLRKGNYISRMRK